MTSYLSFQRKIYPLLTHSTLQTFCAPRAIVFMNRFFSVHEWLHSKISSLHFLWRLLWRRATYFRWNGWKRATLHESYFHCFCLHSNSAINRYYTEAKKEFIFSKLFWDFLLCSETVFGRIACMRYFMWNELTILPCRNATIVIFDEHKMQMTHYLQLSQHFEIVSRDVLNYHAIGYNVLTDANGWHRARSQCHDSQ